MTIQESIERHFPRMAALREQLHRVPEVGFALEKTSACILDELRRLNLEVHTGFAGTGLVGILRGGQPGKTVLLRADMDALPIQETTGLPYASETPGSMHACGHDGHMAALIGAAHALAERRDTLKGNVMFLFQPAEEDADSGAERMIAEGVLDLLPVDAAFSGHLWGMLPAGEIHLKPVVTMPSRDEFSIELRGKGGHGAMPHLAVDPVVMAAQCVLALQTVVSRNVNSYDPAVLSVCRMNTPPGASNIIPDSIELVGTVRTCSQPVRDLILSRMQEVLRGVCALSGGEFSYRPMGHVPELRNDPALAELAVQAAKSVAGDAKVRIPETPMSGSEDFSFFARAVPSCYVFAGIREGDADMPHHNGNFRWNHVWMKPLASFFVAVTLRFLENASGGRGSAPDPAGGNDSPRTPPIGYSA